MEYQSDFDQLLAEIAHLKRQNTSRTTKEIAQEQIIDQLTVLLQSSHQQIHELTVSNLEPSPLIKTEPPLLTKIEPPAPNHFC